MDDNNISEVLNALAKGKNRPATARLREIFNEIEAALRAGVRRKDVHHALTKSGFAISFESFELAIYRIRKERGKKKQPPDKSEVENTGASEKPNGRQAGEATVRPPGITDVGWSEMKAKARAEKRKQKT